MRMTLAPSLALALLCLLHAGAAAAVPDRSEVTCGAPGKGLWALLTRMGVGGPLGGWGQLDTTANAGSAACPAQHSDAAGVWVSVWDAGDVLPGSPGSQPIPTARLQGNGTLLLWPPTPSSSCVRKAT